MIDSNEWGLTRSGFRRPTYAELLTEIEIKAKELFGSSVNLTVRSPLGVFLRIFAWMLDILFSTIENVYNSRFIDTAVGASLYQQGRFIGIQLLPAQRASGYLTFYGEDRTEVPEGFLTSTIEGFQYVTLEKGIIQNGTCTIPASAIDVGTEGNADVDTIRIITNPKRGLSKVCNTQPFIGGRYIETDAEFRERYYQSVDFAGGVNIDAIISEIYESVESVISVTAEENDGNTTDSTGLPPHSIELIVHGGRDEQIAQAIYRRKAAGIRTFGNTTVSVMSSSGKTYPIHFTRPVNVPIWVKISKLKTNNRFSDNGNEEIKKNVVRYIRSGLENVGEGKTVITCVRLTAEILKVLGIVDFEVKIGLSKENLGSDSIQIPIRNKATIEERMVIIE